LPHISTQSREMRVGYPRYSGGREVAAQTLRLWGGKNSLILLVT